MRRSATPVVAVTVTATSGSVPREPGAKMLVCGDGTFFGTIGGGHLESLAIRDAVLALKSGESRTIKYPLGAKTGQCCGGVVDLFFEVLNNGPNLYLFGAGHVGHAVARTLEGTPFRVHVIDERSEWVQSAALSAAAVRHECEWEDFVDSARWDAQNTYVSVMTFRHDTDEKIIEDILRKKRPARYVGLIGSAAKWKKFKLRLTQRGLPEGELERVTSPIGVETGGKAPQEIAISLGAQLLRIHYGRHTGRDAGSGQVFENGERGAPQGTDRGPGKALDLGSA
ncbi:MAG: xanthine dehydrogenase accessory protein XdhC [Oligoflexia bacterium]